MNRLTLRLPESLHLALVRQAEAEGVSLNQLIVYLLTRVTTATDLEQQRTAFEGLLRRHPAAEAEAALQQILGARTARA